MRLITFILLLPFITSEYHTKQIRNPTYEEYKDTSGSSRSVRIVTFSKLSKYLPVKFREFVGHNEVRVGETAYSIFFWKQREYPNFTVRQVKRYEFRIFGQNFIREIPRCHTTKTDDEIKSQLEEFDECYYDIFDRNCRHMSEIMVSIICDTTPRQPDFHFRILSDYLGKWAWNFGNTLGSLVQKMHHHTGTVIKDYINDFYEKSESKNYKCKVVDANR